MSIRSWFHKSIGTGSAGASCPAKDGMRTTKGARTGPRGVSCRTQVPAGRIWWTGLRVGDVLAGERFPVLAEAEDAVPAA